MADAPAEIAASKDAHTATFSSTSLETSPSGLPQNSQAHLGETSPTLQPSSNSPNGHLVPKFPPRPHSEAVLHPTGTPVLPRGEAEADKGRSHPPPPRRLR